ncbi:MAG: hypothetical protein U1E76_12665 [Planctomycetota bacterium]
MAKRKPLEVEEVTEQQSESESQSGLTMEVGLILLTTLSLVAGLILGWLELQKYQGS